MEIGLSRAGKRGELDRFESETIEFFEAIRQAYLDLAEEEPERIVIIDATPDVEDVQTQIEAVLRSLHYLC